MVSTQGFEVIFVHWDRNPRRHPPTLASLFLVSWTLWEVREKETPSPSSFGITPSSLLTFATVSLSGVPKRTKGRLLGYCFGLWKPPFFCQTPFQV
ncbi:hypothetical protein GDO81_026411 [Engystomops pustulosus]|uniref:Uncharacterized protein n=1 Tax=Engystomops pustulosus TaxID=76066 RepID=A0AAV6YIA8_ENGPU|nr:hypothetical protein GDO81_026411 [Engystomops pustulosus]